MVAQMKVRARVKGERIVKRNLSELARSLNPSGDDMGEALLAGAEYEAGLMKAKAPQGRTGNLRRGIVAYNAKRVAGGAPRRKGWARPQKLRPNEAAADSLAPHSHLVEFGRAAVVAGQGKRSKSKVFKSEGGAYFFRKAKAAAPRPFWRPALYDGEAEAVKAVERHVVMHVRKAGGE